jgi:hypothetical protein
MRSRLHLNETMASSLHVRSGQKPTSAASKAMSALFELREPIDAIDKPESAAETARRANQQKPVQPCSQKYFA